MIILLRSRQIVSVKAQLEPLQQLYRSLLTDRSGLESRLSSTLKPYEAKQPFASTSGSTNYQTSSFPWTNAIRKTLDSTFGIPSFRLCQEGVVNAAMDDKDIVCVMPTGGGKSLTYQLPAVMGKSGLTVVVSPLLALIWDQVRAMKEIGVEAVVR